MCVVVFFLMIRRPPRSTLDRSSAASDVYKRQREDYERVVTAFQQRQSEQLTDEEVLAIMQSVYPLSLIHISEPTRPY